MEKEINKIILEKLTSLDFIKVLTNLADELHVEAFLVGGFVRDILLNREKSELDFLIVGDGPSFAREFAKRLGYDSITMYKNYGTAHFNYCGYNLEFVGSRRESYSRDSRKPKIEVGTFIDDISRRDFTINTLAVSLNSKNYGKLIDTFGGLADIENRIIKTPLDPNITFDDDPLRIMRAFRFASQINFSIDQAIFNSAEQLKDRMTIVSQERITDEFFKILSSPQPSIGLKHLFNTKVLQIIFPEIAKLGGVEQRQDHHHKDVFLHTCLVVDNISSVSDNVWLRFAALVHDIAKPQTKKFIDGIGWSFHGHEEFGARMMKSIFYRMKLPLNKLEYVQKLIRLHLRPIALADEEVTDSAIRRLIVEAGEDLEDLITLCRADITSKNPDKVTEYLNNYERVMNRVLDVKEKDALRAFQSPVKGDEIMQICGLKPGKKVGEIKTAIEEAILDGKIGNNHSEALSFLYKIKDDYL
jgi:tRNA nucleotidyltransferase/poly(A) polymerase